MFLSEHSVTYDLGHTRMIVTRKVFENAGRILGTERIRVEAYRGYDGWKWRERDTQTRQFGHRNEASAWMDEMFNAHDVWKVQNTQVDVPADLIPA